MSEWQPIATAPEHTRVFVLFRFKRGGWNAECAELVDGTWQLFDGEYNIGVTATHWMSCPQPPSETPSKYDTSPECSGQGGAHFTTCSHSSAKIETVCNVVEHQIVGKCTHCGNEIVESLQAKTKEQS